MGPVRQNPIQRTVRTAHLSVLMTVHNFSTQYNTDSSDNLPSYLPAHSIGEKTDGEVSSPTVITTYNSDFTKSQPKLMFILRDLSKLG